MGRAVQRLLGVGSLCVPEWDEGGYRERSRAVEQAVGLGGCVPRPQGEEAVWVGDAQWPVDADGLTAPASATVDHWFSCFSEALDIHTICITSDALHTTPAGKPPQTGPNDSRASAVAVHPMKAPYGHAHRRPTMRWDAIPSAPKGRRSLKLSPKVGPGLQRPSAFKPLFWTPFPPEPWGGTLQHPTGSCS